MSGRFRKEWRDRDVLEVLDLFDRQGLTGEAIGQRFGVSRGAILGMVKRIRDEMQRIPDLTTKRENQDGALPARWWDTPAQMRRK